MSNVNEDQVRDSLKQCMDPEVPLSIVDMGLIYGIDVTENNDVNIKMTMTTKGCPLHETMVDDVKAKMKTMGAQSTPAPINYETAVPQGVGNLVKQEDGSLVLANEHEQGFMVNQAIIDFWKSCNGKRKVTELVDMFAQQTGLQRSQVEKEVMQLLKQLHEGGLLVIPNQNDAPNVEFKGRN